MQRIREERIKATAAWCNGLSVACFAVGVLSPVLSSPSPWKVALAMLIPTLGLKIASRRHLKGLKHDD